METTLFYARAACDTMMRKFAAADLPPKGHFYYHQGVFLSGVLKTWQLTGEQKYLDYAASWVHAVFDESGKVKQYKRADLDDIQAGILLYPLYDATGDEFYRRCIESVAAQVQDIPRCQCGGFWHTCARRTRCGWTACIWSARSSRSMPAALTVRNGRIWLSTRFA